VAAFSLTRTGTDRYAAVGALGFETAAHALREGTAMIAGQGEQVVDLAGITDADSAGLAVLVEWLAAARARGAGLRYENVPGQLLAIARISDLDGLLLGR
jgi:phospholipid transport system transporter-binding protein